MQEITRHLSDIEMELSELGRKLEDVRQQIRDVSVMTANPVRQVSAEQTKTNRKRQNQSTYGSTYRPDKWMNISISAAVTNGIQETWSVGDEQDSSYIDPYTDPYTGPYEGSYTGSYERSYAGSYSGSSMYGGTQNKYGFTSSNLNNGVTTSNNAESGLTSSIIGAGTSGNFARQSEYSIHARP